MALALTGSPPITAAALDAAVNTELTTNWFPLAGVATNSNAAAGTIGEYISSTVLTAAAVSLTTNVSADITTVSLTAGDWDVWGLVVTKPGGTTTTSYLQGWINTVSATPPTLPAGGYVALSCASTAGAVNSFPTGMIRLSLATTTTVYLSTNEVFAVSTLGAYGFIGARRVR